MRITKVNIRLRISVPTILVRTGVWIVLAYRKMRYGYPFRRIPLTRGMYAIVDPEDYEWLMQFKWHTNCSRGKFYAVNSKMQKMHRLIMFGEKQEDRRQKTRLRLSYVGQAGDKNRRCRIFVDHINGDGRDNRKANLRFATPAQNNWNSKHGMGRGKSQYKGVKWHKHVKKWAAVISVDGLKKHLGYYMDEKEAAKAFDRAAKKLRGEFAVLNFPDS
jgi:hypothetical protein